jgi:hypothetical protein
MNVTLPALTAVCLLALPAQLLAEDTSSSNGKPGVVPFIKVLSDKIPEDVSSLEAWKKSVIKDGMSEKEKAIKVWETVVKFRQQNQPPTEHLHHMGCVHDPIKTFNVYGYGMCCCASSNISSLARYAGLEARGWALANHSVPEVKFDDAWHLLDASLITYYLNDAKAIAGVEELSTNMGLFNKEHCPWVDDAGRYPAQTHKIFDSAKGYKKGDKTPYPFEYGYSSGYQVNIQLREGERLQRNWYNKGLHVNMDRGAPGHLCINEKTGQGELCWSPKWGDIAPGRIGNGVHEYNLPLASGAFKAGALSVENLVSQSEDQKSPAMHLKDAAQPGTLIFRMPSSYVYLTGEVALNAVIGNGGEIAVAFSDNNGLDWKDVQKITASGEQKIDLKPLVYRRYDYRLKFTLKGAGTGLGALKVVHDVQHSQRPLPALGQGKNTISFSTGPNEGTISIEGAVDPKRQDKQLLLSDFKPVLDNMKFGDSLAMTAEKGSITIPVSTPGEMTRLRFGSHYRARGDKDQFEYQVSFDGGKTFKTVDVVKGPMKGMCKYITYSDIPAGTKEAQIRFNGSQNNTLCIFDICIDADYKLPNGGFRPVKVTYIWDENGAEKTDVHIARQATETYTIDCATKPTMKSLIVELE